MHLKRWITGLTALPLLIFLIYSGGTMFAVFIAIVSLLTQWEYFRILFRPPESDWYGPLPVIGFVTGTAIIWAAYIFTLDIVCILLAFNVIACALYSIVRFKNDPAILEKVNRQIQGVIYVPFFLSFVIFLRNGTDGMLWIFFLIGTIFAGDIGAFYAGTHFGKHKLCPSVSPGKTIEGSIGGLTANVLIGSLIKLAFLPRLDWGPSILFFLSIGIVGQIGDLFESQFKRAAGVKDSGVILPGHGGFLDRIDALLFALPVAYFFKKFILWV